MLYHIWVWKPFWSCDLKMKVIFRLSHPRNTPYKIWVESIMWFLKNHFRLICSSWKWATLDEMTMVNLTCVLIYNHCPIICYTYLASLMILALTGIEKSTFQDFSHTNASGIIFELAKKEVKVNLGSLFVQSWLGPHPQSYNYLDPRSLVFWFLRRFFWQGFFPCTCHLCKLSSPHPEESPYELNWPSGFRKDIWICWRMGRRRTHWYTYRSPLNIRLRWANNNCKLSESPKLCLALSIHAVSFLDFSALKLVSLLIKLTCCLATKPSVW